jgi:hypothetical protein
MARVLFSRQLGANDLDGPQCDLHFDQSEMKDFYELEDWKQCELLFELIERMGANDVSSLEQLSKKEGRDRKLFGQRCASRADLSYATFPSAYLVGVWREVCFESGAVSATSNPP